jgi:DNA polymerase III sliding clamp (beta) subunit (PCNA family)
MDINVRKFKAILEQLKPGLANKEIVDQTTSFAFINGKVVTYNDEISISCELPEMADFRGAIRSESIYDFVANIPEESITITPEGTHLNMKAGKTKVSIPYNAEVKLPLDELGEVAKWRAVPEELINALMFVAPAASANRNFIVVSSVHMTPEGVVEASDGFRVAQVTLPKLPISRDMVVPIRSILNLSHYSLEGIAETKGWVHFTCNSKKLEEFGGDTNVVFSSRLISEKYPDISSKGLFDTEGGSKFLFPENTLSALSKASIFAPKDDLGHTLITFEFKKAGLMISAESPKGSSQEILPVKGGSLGDGFVIHSESLMRILNLTRRCVLCKNKLIMEKDNWKYSLMLISRGEE